MNTITYMGEDYLCHDEETVLDALLRQGVDIKFSCRNGVCHACLQHAEEGEIPSDAQKGLSEEKRAQKLFMPCKCYPQGDIKMVPPGQRKQKDNSTAQEVEKPQPDPEMWQALQEGELLSQIMQDFYSQVYQDPRLSPFFHGVTQQRAAEKQYQFLRQIFTGEKVYFGDRPRNAHHWMVITDELFDYREQIMVETLRRHGLADYLIERWRQMEERFRGDIVKDKPWKRRMGDVELPVDGFGETELEIGSICDGCGAEVDSGITVRYHLRLGTIYCPSCM